VRADVVLLVGPSGCGKTYLATSASDCPILALDDFYRADTDAGLPRSPDGDVDWESPRSWDGDAAHRRARSVLCTHRCRSTCPTYSFAENRAVGTKVHPPSTAPRSWWPRGSSRPS
jgi:uridine kinase